MSHDISRPAGEATTSSGFSFGSTLSVPTSKPFSMFGQPTTKQIQPTSHMPPLSGFISFGQPTINSVPVSRSPPAAFGTQPVARTQTTFGDPVSSSLFGTPLSFGASSNRTQSTAANQPAFGFGAMLTNSAPMSRVSADFGTQPIARTQLTFGGSSSALFGSSPLSFGASSNGPQSTASKQPAFSFGNSLSTTRVPGSGQQPFDRTQPTVGNANAGFGFGQSPAFGSSSTNRAQFGSISEDPSIFKFVYNIPTAQENPHSISRISQINHLGSIIGIFSYSGRFFFEPFVLLDPMVVVNETQGPSKCFYVRLTIQMWNPELRSRVLKHLQTLPALAGINIHEDDVTVMPFKELKLISDPSKSLLYSIQVASDGSVSYSGSPQSLDFFLKCEHLSAANAWAEEFKRDPQCTLKKLQLECSGEWTRFQTYKFIMGVYPNESSDGVFYKHLLRRLDGFEREVKDLKNKIRDLMESKRNV